jgi:TRAP-type C4-dicarboxylate transport system permease small subunit
VSSPLVSPAPRGEGGFLLRRVLAALYECCGWLAGGFLIAILATILLQIGGPIFGYIFRAGDELSGYCMAASFFLALAHAFGRGEHIRVTLIVERFAGRARRAIELWALGAGSLLAGFFAFYAVKMCWLSWVLKDVSQGLIPFPLWIPQLGMAVGVVVLAVALVEQLIVVAAGGPLPENKARE